MKKADGLDPCGPPEIDDSRWSKVGLQATTSVGDDAAGIPKNEPRSSGKSGRLLRKLAAHKPRYRRYVHRGEIGRGGMGIVLSIWDRTLRRELAMKVISSRGAVVSGPGVRPVNDAHLARFLEEAQVSAQLEHPGIVPVHDLGVDENGHAFFTMRLVRGQTLDEIFKLLRTGKDGWHQTRALNVVLKVCEAMAYAHDRKVVHRDLKPSNIMVGRFGETYVMDWGLARVIGAPAGRIIPRSAESGQQEGVRTDRSDDAGFDPCSPLLTIDEEVMGTPAYMPPEQAAGRLNDVGVPADIYSVGAILYHLLTGRMPYSDLGCATPGELLECVRSGSPRPIHQFQRRVPVELQSICEKAMKPHPEDRYHSMMSLADDLRSYMEGRVVQAHRTGSLAELQKWLVRNKGVAAALAAVFLTLLAGVSGVSLVQQQKNVELATAFGRVNAERNRALESEALASKERAQAVVARQAAEAARSLALQSEAEALRERQLAVMASEEARDEATRSASMLAFLQEMLGSASPSANVRHTLVVDVLDSASHRLRTGFGGRPTLKVPLQLTIGSTYAALGLHGEAEPHFRDAVELSQRTSGGGSAMTLRAMNRLANLLMTRGRLDEAAKYCPGESSFAPTASALLGQERVRSLAIAARIRQKKGEHSLAAAEFARILQLCETLFGPDATETMTARTDLAISLALSAPDRSGQTEGTLRESLQWRREHLGEDDPQTLESDHDLALFLANRGIWDQAEGLAATAMDGRTSLLGREHPQTIQSMGLMARISEQLQGPAVAEHIYYRQWRSLLAEGDGMDEETLAALDSLARTIQAQDRLEEAEDLYRQSLILHRFLYGNEDPRNVERVEILAGLLEENGRPEAAIPFLRELVKRRPDSAKYRRRLQALEGRQASRGSECNHHVVAKSAPSISVFPVSRSAHAQKVDELRQARSQLRSVGDLAQQYGSQLSSMEDRLNKLKRENALLRARLGDKPR